MDCRAPAPPLIPAAAAGAYHELNRAAFLRPLEDGLTDLPQVTCTAEGAARLRNGNPGMVIATGVEYGEECWASLDGRAVAVGRFKGGELHPSRVFNQPSGEAGA